MCYLFEGPIGVGNIYKNNPDPCIFTQYPRTLIVQSSKDNCVRRILWNIELYTFFFIPLLLQVFCSDNNFMKWLYLCRLKSVFMVFYYTGTYESASIVEIQMSHTDNTFYLCLFFCYLVWGIHIMCWEMIVVKYLTFVFSYHMISYQLILQR